MARRRTVRAASARAVLFNEFMLGEGQEIFARRNMAVTNPKIPSMPPWLEITLIDPADMLDNRSKWDELWRAR